MADISLATFSNIFKEIFPSLLKSHVCFYGPSDNNYSPLETQTSYKSPRDALFSGVPDFFDRNKILSGGDLSHYQVPHCIRVFFYFVWFVFIHHNFQFYFELCTYCDILDIYLS